MARPNQESIETFMRITGSSESVALQKLEAYGGNLNEAVNAYFIEGNRSISNPPAGFSPPNNIVDTNNRVQPGPSRLLQLLSAARTFRPSLLLDPSYRRSLINEFGASALISHTPVSRTGGMVGLPGEFNSWNEQPHHAGFMPSDYNGRISPSYQIMGTQGNVSRDDDSHLDGNDIEEEMIQAAIEASRREDSSGIGVMQRQLDLEDDELSCAVSLSLQTAEQEKAMRELVLKDKDQQLRVCGLGMQVDKNDCSNRKFTHGNSSVQEGAKDVQARSSESYMYNRHNAGDHSQSNKYVLPLDEWGGISPEELDEAVRIETELFGDIPHRSKHEPQPQSAPDTRVGPKSLPAPHQPSLSLMEKRLLREQQDNEYLASLLADREKEVNALKEAESLCLKEDESCKTLLEEENLERWLPVKETSLPPEPASEDENAVTLLVKMPDGSRRGHSFLKSDKLQFLFDFIDVGRVVKPGTYRVVRPYPRRAFDICDASLSFSDLGLTSKQEALFLELI
ncbi:plant UBX domain-containing protein 8-like [Mangifera indica]|uniref:plant UBX domain-containing protein 8-like n=1 Tax=Mangifera indica TaxID=29780 RepID=UPI001CFBD5F9|nr:plant UBX domain-containing protein 8-like [Mangifera indica]